ncbi:MAG: hypothetical protein H7249_12095 [Chitinophagaceae bacterium]|nr:hypothetical protein [Oligoflexus sp.]
MAPFFITLGEVTLSAIVDRVLLNARRAFPWIGSFSVRSDELVLDAMSIQGLTDSELEAGIRRVLEELIKVIDSLTGGALTPQLFDVLSQSPLAFTKQ